MKTVKDYSKKLAHGIGSLGRSTARYALSRLRMLLGVGVLAFGGSLLWADALPEAEADAERVVPAVQIPPGYTGIGPVISGSVAYENVPSKARKFLQKYCDGHAIVKCEKEYTSGDYKISLAVGIDMEFDAKGNMVAINAPDGYSLSPMLLRAVVPGKLYHLLDHNGFKESVEGMHHDNAGYRLKVADPVFNAVCYDSSGVLTLVVDK